jgi:hypothetical protein
MSFLKIESRRNRETGHSYNKNNKRYVDVFLSSLSFFSFFLFFFRLYPQKTDLFAIDWIASCVASISNPQRCFPLVGKFLQKNARQNRRDFFVLFATKKKSHSVLVPTRRRKCCHTNDSSCQSHCSYTSPGRTDCWRWKNCRNIMTCALSLDRFSYILYEAQ